MKKYSNDIGLIRASNFRIPKFWLSSINESSMLLSWIKEKKNYKIIKAIQNKVLEQVSKRKYNFDDKKNL